MNGTTVSIRCGATGCELRPRTTSRRSINDSMRCRIIHAGAQSAAGSDREARLVRDDDSLSAAAPGRAPDARPTRSAPPDRKLEPEGDAGSSKAGADAGYESTWRVKAHAPLQIDRPTPPPITGWQARPCDVQPVASFYRGATVPRAACCETMLPSSP